MLVLDLIGQELYKTDVRNRALFLSTDHVPDWKV